jgi:hypothetical protein
MNRLRQVAPFAFAFATSMASAGPASAANPTTIDCLSANDKSIALRNQHKLMAARTELLVCASASCPGEVRKDCVRRIEQVNASMPTIVFEAKDESGNDLTAVTIKMDGEVITEQLDGTAISIDPGAHTFTIDAIGQPTVTKQLVIREGQKDRREQIQVRTLREAATASSPALPPPTAPSAPQPAAPEHRGLGAQKTAALAAVAIGAVGMGIGTVFGLQSMSKHDQASEVCPGVCRDEVGVKLWDDARASGNIATIGFVIGTAGVLGGAVLWLTAKPSETTSLRASVGPGSLQVQGSW